MSRDPPTTLYPRFFIVSPCWSIRSQTGKAGQWKSKTAITHSHYAWWRVMRALQLVLVFPFMSRGKVSREVGKVLRAVQVGNLSYWTQHAGIMNTLPQCRSGWSAGMGCLNTEWACTPLCASGLYGPPEGCVCIQAGVAGCRSIYALKLWRKWNKTWSGFFEN